MIDIKKLKEQLDIGDYTQIIEALDIPIVRTNSKIWSLKGGCHNINCGETDDNLKFYVNTKTFTCYSHNCITGGDIIELVLLRKRLSNPDYKFTDALDFIVENSSVDIKNIQHKGAKIDKTFNTLKFLKKYTKAEYEPTECKIYRESVLNLFPNIYHRSWIEDNITVDTMEKYEIAYYPLKQQIIIPVRDEYNQLVGIRSRCLLPEDLENGYKYIPTKTLNGTEYTFPTGAILYGLDKNAENIVKKKQAILVESEKAVMQLDGYGYDNAVAMFGLNLGKQRAEMLLSLDVEEIIIAIDKDYHCGDTKEFETFKNNVFKVAKDLRGRVKLSIVWDNEDLLGYKNSPTDKGKDVWETLYKEREVLA